MSTDTAPQTSTGQFSLFSMLALMITLMAIGAFLARNIDTVRFAQDCVTRTGVVATGACPSAPVK